MKLIQEKLTIVLAGAFNPAILTPQWVAKNALGYAPDKQIQVELMTGFGGISTSPRFSFDGVSYTANLQSLIFYIADQTPEQRENVCQVAGKVLSELLHTPVTGVGFNFGFRVENPNGDLLNLLQTHDATCAAIGETAKVVSREWTNVISLDDALITVHCQLEGTEVSVEVNYHYNVSSANDAAAVMRRPKVYTEHFSVVLNAAKALTGQELEEQ